CASALREVASAGEVVFAAPLEALMATTSGPAVAARVRSYGLLLTPRKASPRVRVVVAAMIASSSIMASVLRRCRSRRTRRQTSTMRPMPSALQPGQRTEMPGAPAGQPGLIDEGAVAHRDQPVGGGGDPRVVGDDDQRLPGL